MSTPQEILQSMIDTAPAKSTDVAKSIATIDVMIADFQAKQDAMKHGIGDVATSRLEAYLQTLYPAPNYHQKNGSTYNLIETSTGSLTDWKIYHLLALAGITFVTSTQFTCSGDQTALFKTNDDVGFTLIDSRVYSTVLNDSTYDSGTNLTTIDINDPVLDTTLFEVWKFHITYTPGNTTIDGYVSQWNFAHDYIVAPLGLTTGTYGTQDNINKLTDARNMLALNKLKFDNTESAFESYV